MSDHARDNWLRRLTVSLFGRFEARLDDQPLDGFEYNKVRALLAYLAVENNRPHSRGYLCTLLWPEQAESAARQNLSQALTRLRQVLGDKQAAIPFLRTTTESVELDVLESFDVDVLHFAALIADAERHPHRGWHLCTLCAAKLAEAVECYQGDFLAHFYVSDSELFEEWALLLRQRLRQQMLSALERLIQYAEWRGEMAGAIQYARRQVELEPLRDRGQRELMRLLALSGQQTAALAQYEFLYQTLRVELDDEPEAETTALYEKISADDSIEGLRRFTLPSVNLPPFLTPMIGREVQVSVLCERLSGGGAYEPARLITLTGAPGIGKTRLALEVAHWLRFDFHEGVHLVELAPVQEGADVPALLASVLGVKESPGRTRLEAVVDYLQPAHCLLVLDNFEQLVDAAPLVGTLLEQCPLLSVLVTSRVPLHLRAEYQFALDPLTIPVEGATYESVTKSEAVRLFERRARAVRPEFAVTAENAPYIAAICRRLDGLPLAIELIAPRLKSRTLCEILEQWESSLSAVAPGARDVPTRHRTLRHAIEWSYDRLSPDEQQLFEHLGLFVGGGTVESVQALLDSPAPVSVLLDALHDASLLYTKSSETSTRFMLLETIGEFALARLTVSGELALARARHMDYFAQLADQAYTELLGMEQQKWSTRIAEEQDNLRAALRWAMSQDFIEEALRISTGIWRFWWQRGLLREGLQWLELGLARRHEGSPAMQIRALRAASVLAMGLNDFTRARQWSEQALEVARERGAPYDVAAATTNLGLVLREQGEFECARPVLEEAVALNRALPDTRSVKFPLMILAGLYASLGNIDGASDLYDESLRLNRELGDTEGTANALYGIGAVAHARGEYQHARQWCQESVALYHSLNHQFGLAWCYNLLGNIERDQGESAEALRQYRQSLAFWLQREDHVSAAASLDSLATCWYQMGEPAQAVRVTSAAQAIRQASHAGLTPYEQGNQESKLAACRAMLGERAYNAAWRDGRSLRPQEALEWALRVEEPAQFQIEVHSALSLPALALRAAR